MLLMVFHFLFPQVGLLILKCVVSLACVSKEDLTFQACLHVVLVSVASLIKYHGSGQ